MNVTQISKIKVSKTTNQFQQLTCKQQSHNSFNALSNLINKNQHLLPQFMHISMMRQRLDLIALILKKNPMVDSLKIINYMCKNMNKFQAKQMSLIWNILYSQDKGVFKYQIFYECLVTFPFGGANRNAQHNSLFILLELIDLVSKRQDNKILSRICENYMQNFRKYNILDINYFRVMNKVLSVSQNFEGFVRIDVQESLNRYLKHLKLAKEKKWHNLQIEILKGIGLLGQILMRSEYLIGSIFNVVLFNIQSYLEDKIFGVRDAARAAIKSWKIVQKRIQSQKKQKQQLISQDQENSFSKFEVQPKILNMIDYTGKYLIKKDYAEKKVFSQLSSSAQEHIQRKQFLKKKTGNGGGYIYLQNKAKSNIAKSKYEQIIDYVIQQQKQYKPKLKLQEYEWYPNNSHITPKYNLQQTVQYENNEDLYLLELIDTNKNGSQQNMTTKQIQQLIDIAYNKMW